MRGFLLAGIAFASALTPLSALASSLEYVRAAPISTPSVTTMECSGCPALEPSPRSTTYVVPELEPGTDRSEIRDINGQMKIVREEAWLGGSPVTFVSKASAEDIRIARGEPAVPPLVLQATAVGDAGGGVSAETSLNVAVDAATTASLTPTSVVLLAAASVAPLPAPSSAADDSSSHNFDGQSLQLRLN